MLLAPLGSRKARRGDRQPASPTPRLGCSLLAPLVHPLAPEAMAGTCLLLISTLFAVLRSAPMYVLWMLVVLVGRLEHRLGDAG